MNPRERFENLARHHEDHIAEKGMSLSDASSNENSRCKISSGQRMGEARTVVSVAIIHCEEQQGHSGSTKRKKGKSTLLH